MSELLDIRSGSDFGFLQFKKCKNELKEAFLENCEQIMRNAQDTVKHFCLIGMRLQTLKQMPGYHFVVDENGEAYSFNRFDEFCERAFGFSKTRTSNFLSLGAFLTEKDGNVEFIEPKYEAYNLSQLIELSSVSRYDHRFFAPSFTVKEMRLVKKMLGKVYNEAWTAEEMLENAKKRFEVKEVKPIEQMQIELTEEVEEAKSDVGITAPTETEVERVEENVPEEAKNGEKVPATGFRGEFLSAFAKRIERCGIKATVHHRGLSADFTAEELAKEMERRFIYSLLDNRTSLKHLIQEFVTEHLGRYDYEITLNGRKQGITVFAGALADTLCRGLEAAVKSEGK